MECWLASLLLEEVVVSLKNLESSRFSQRNASSGSKKQCNPQKCYEPTGVNPYKLSKKEIFSLILNVHAFNVDCLLDHCPFYHFIFYFLIFQFLLV